jgi:hypothetical protein
VYTFRDHALVGPLESGAAAIAMDESTVKNMRVTLLVLGILAGLIGLVWVGQGTGYFPYPSSSFMINQTTWVYYGVVLAILGLVAVVVSRWI